MRKHPSRSLRQRPRPLLCSNRPRLRQCSKPKCSPLSQRPSHPCNPQFPLQTKSSSRPRRNHCFQRCLAKSSPSLRMRRRHILRSSSPNMCLDSSQPPRNPRSSRPPLTRNQARRRNPRLPRSQARLAQQARPLTAQQCPLRSSHCHRQALRQPPPRRFPLPNRWRKHQPRAQTPLIW